jgi:Fe-S cluster biogenesis protein NfuA
MLFVEDVDLTPNPHALKFLLNERILNFEKRQYSKKDEVENDPFAEGNFNIDGVVSVFYMDKFVTIEKAADANWGQIQKPFVQFLKGFDKNLIPAEKGITKLGESELLKKINEVLDTRVKPALAGDGGGLEVIGLDNFTVRIRYQGACGSCPSAISGTLAAIEGLLKRDVNPLIEVIPA